MSNLPQPSPAERAAWSTAQAAWHAWLDHVNECKSTCRTQGRDCPRAINLREDIRTSRKALREVRAAAPRKKDAK